jgi:hypothetical protein
VKLANVRFGSKADMCSARRRVRFTPNSDRESVLPQKVMSALPPKADMCGAPAHVCFVPIADMRGLREHFQTNAGVRGKTILISVNSPGCVSTSMVPACCFTMTS